MSYMTLADANITVKGQKVLKGIFNVDNRLCGRMITIMYCFWQSLDTGDIGPTISFGQFSPSMRHINNFF